jgi:hypothetical protein
MSALYKGCRIVWRAVLVAVALILCIHFSAARRVTLAVQEPVTIASCSAPEYHQFDFWLGSWDALDFNTLAKDGHARIDRILDGCVIHEDYQSVDGHRGQSFSIYDASRKVWHQTWVTNRGTLLVIEGKFESGQMVLTGIDHQHGDSLVRGTWKPVQGGVRETAVRSTDGGKTWQPWFDLIFRPDR